MIIKTSTPDQFRTLKEALKSEGYTYINNAILPNNIAGDNYVEIVHNFAGFALTSDRRAELMGFTPYEESPFVQKLLMKLPPERKKFVDSDGCTLTLAELHDFHAAFDTDEENPILTGKDLAILATLPVGGRLNLSGSWLERVE